MPISKPLFPTSVGFVFDSNIYTGFITLALKYPTPENAYAIHKVVPEDMEYSSLYNTFKK